MLANETVYLSAGNSTNISSVLNLTSQEFGWAINGTHNITVIVDPYNQVDELNEKNNARTVQIDVNPSLDFAVTNIYFEPKEPVLNDNIEIKANITNFGNRSLSLIHI